MEDSVAAVGVAVAGGVIVWPGMRQCAVSVTKGQVHAAWTVFHTRPSGHSRGCGVPPSHCQYLLQYRSGTKYSSPHAGVAKPLVVCVVALVGGTGVLKGRSRKPSVMDLMRL